MQKKTANNFYRTQCSQCQAPPPSYHPIYNSKRRRNIPAHSALISPPNRFLFSNLFSRTSRQPISPSPALLCPPISLSLSHTKPSFSLSISFSRLQRDKKAAPDIGWHTPTLSSSLQPFFSSGSTAAAVVAAPEKISRNSISPLPIFYIIHEN